MDDISKIMAGLALFLLVVMVPWLLVRRWRRKAERLGYPGLGAYLRGVPRTDAEKAEAIEMTLKGFVFCVVGIIAPPLLIVGAFPLYYGMRKMCIAWMGLEIVDEGEAGETPEPQ